MAKRKKSKVLTSLDELYDHDGKVLCRFCESCDLVDDVVGRCSAAEEEDSKPYEVMLDAAECDCGELVSKELSVLNACLNGRQG